MTYKEARVYLDEMSKYGSVLGLETIRGLLRELGNPQDDLQFIHIAGTNGKGSVLAYTSTILSEAGYRVGRYVSPTVISYLERIQVDGMWISEDMFALMTSLVKDAIARLEAANQPLPTVFETETAIAFLYFRNMGCDFVVLETGLGGAGDATNIIKNTLCAVFTSIGRDHIGVIGNTVGEIALEKAGIIKSRCAVVSAVQLPCVTKVLSGYAYNHRCTFTQVESEQVIIHHANYREIELSYRDFSHMKTSLTGEYQTGNLCTALEVILTLRNLGYPVPSDAVYKAVSRTVWPGRFTCLGESPVFIIDGAHNRDAAYSLRRTLDTYFPGKHFIFIVGVFRDKEYRDIVRIMCSRASCVYTVDLPDRHRTLPACTLADVIRKYYPSTDIRPLTRENVPIRSGVIRDQNPVTRAVIMATEQASSEDIIVAFGSLSYLHQIKQAYESLYHTAET